LLLTALNYSYTKVLRKLGYTNKHETVFYEKRIETKEEEVADDGCLHGGIVGRLRYSDLA
ncbi:hypothetical protein, partial [Bacteroides uniformis]